MHTFLIVLTRFSSPQTESRHRAPHASSSCSSSRRRFHEQAPRGARTGARGRWPRWFRRKQLTRAENCACSVVVPILLTSHRRIASASVWIPLYRLHGWSRICTSYSNYFLFAYYTHLFTLRNFFCGPLQICPAPYPLTFTTVRSAALYRCKHLQLFVGMGLVQHTALIPMPPVRIPFGYNIGDGC